jgi:hypothetical protein
MATTFPTALQDLDATRGTAADNMAAPNHVTHHQTEDDTIEALQAKVGIDGSAVTTSHDYKLGNVAGADRAASVTGTETLTNKTLTSPTINTPTITSPTLTLGSDATGDVYYRDAGGNLVRLAIGTNGQQFQVVAGLPAWVTTATSADVRYVQVQVYTASTELATGDGANGNQTIIPLGMNGYELTAVLASMGDTNPVGSTVTVQVRNLTQAADMLTTPITIDAGEKTSATAATAAVIDTANDDVATGDDIRIDIDQVGSTTAGNGLTVLLTFTQP